MSRIAFRIVGILFLSILVLAACSPGQKQSSAPTVPEKNADGYTDISVDQLAEMLQNKDFTLVNVHIPYEGDLPQTDLSIPYNEIDQHLDQLPGKDEPIVLYCNSGNMSTQAARTLAQLGYTNLMELDGGFTAWKAAGNEFLHK
ncbi:MAG: rhodanese-like domain-containing protein [Caldilineales bacterium]|nr:rhodanese-like domain-containing protein [Caldilineales bacterium]